MFWFKAQALRPDSVGFNITVATYYLCDLLKRIPSPRVCFPFGKMGLMTILIPTQALLQESEMM